MIQIHGRCSATAGYIPRAALGSRETLVGVDLGTGWLLESPAEPQPPATRPLGSLEDRKMTMLCIRPVRKACLHLVYTLQIYQMVTGSLDLLDMFRCPTGTLPKLVAEQPLSWLPCCSRNCSCSCSLSSHSALLHSSDSPSSFHFIQPLHEPHGLRLFVLIHSLRVLRDRNPRVLWTDVHLLTTYLTCPG